MAEPSDIFCEWEAEEGTEFVCKKCKRVAVQARPGLKRACTARTTTAARKNGRRADPFPGVGTGTQLSRLIARCGIKVEAGCGCKHYAAALDLRGPLWCIGHRGEIAGWLKNKSHKRNIRWRPVAVRALIWLAIVLAIASGLRLLGRRALSSAAR